ncbi:MAG TPA: glycosyltransferase family 4 protein [Methylotenera sp.]
MRTNSSDQPKIANRICHIIATTEGAAWVFEQLRDLRNRFGYDVTVILNGETGALVDRFKSENIRVLVSDFNFLGSGDLLSVPRKIWHLKQLLERERFDVVQTHLFHSMVIGRIAAWFADVPVRLAMIAGPFHLEAYTPRWIDVTTQWMETALIPSCEYTRTLYRTAGVSADRLNIIYYGPDEEKFNPVNHQQADLRSEFGWPDRAPIIGMIAYFYPELGVNRWTPPAVQGKAVKCQANLIKAMPAILVKFPTAKLVFVGSAWGDEGEKYFVKMKSLVEELGLSDSINFTGYRTDIPSILKSLDVCVQASLSENLGGSIEGLLMERPMVSTRVGGLVDSVIDGKTGVLVEPDDIASGILRLLEYPAKAKAMGLQGREYMLEKFTLLKTVEAEHALYQALAARSSKGYRWYVQAYRLILGAAVSVYLALRYRFLDSKLLPALDSGWRPWRFVGTRRFLIRVIDALIRRLGPAKKPEATVTQHEDIEIKVNKSERFYSVDVSPLPQIKSKLTMLATMALYRFYSFIGRQKLGWGLRKRAMNILRRLFSKT